MPSFGKRVDGPQGRRKATRKPTSLCVSASTVSGSYSVLVTDVSTTGAKLRGRNLPAAGNELLLRVGQAAHLARIAWVEQEYCGIHFEPDLNDAEVVHLKQEGHIANLIGLT